MNPTRFVVAFPQRHGFPPGAPVKRNRGSIRLGNLQEYLTSRGAAQRLQ